ncbi:cytochrome P450 4V2-like isoform X1 [Maniola jurtina]|uniref:cytochrome P450 4V2-like isoform X1 n=2 Tax=Maniola jurtina TaxID=191418 RepID=UPI001E68A236|nr:cytochrome P450 4V2-like isoform X1 [Maniola jurtina]
MFIYLLLFIAFTLISLYLRYVNVRLNKLIPTVPNALSIFEIGLYNIDMREIFKKITHIGEWTNSNGGVTKFTFGPIVVYVISSAPDMSTVLTRCLDKMFIYDLIRPYVGAEMVAASVPVWKRNRRILDAAFKPHVLDGYINLFNHQAMRLTETMANHVNTDMDFTKIITRNLLETVSQTTMGMKIDGEDLITDSYSKAVDKVMETITDRFRYPWNILDFVFNNFSTLKKEQDDALKIIWSLSDQMVKQKKEEILHKHSHKQDYQNKGVKFQSSLEILLENTMNSENDSMLTDLQLRQIVDNLMLAGFDTTAPTILLALVCIGSYPRVQEKVYNEIINELGKEARPIFKDDLPKLPYLEAVMKETLRLYPSGTVVARTTTTEVQLENFAIPAGCHVMGHIWALNRNKEYWGPDADEFRPERWLDDVVPTHPAAFATFSPGRRNCIGKSYVMTLMKITLAHVIRKFHITADDSKLELEFVILLKPAAGHSIQLELRSDEKYR